MIKPCTYYMEYTIYSTCAFMDLQWLTFSCILYNKLIFRTSAFYSLTWSPQQGPPFPAENNEGRLIVDAALLRMLYKARIVSESSYTNVSYYQRQYILYIIYIYIYSQINLIQFSVSARLVRVGLYRGFFLDPCYLYPIFFKVAPVSLVIVILCLWSYYIWLKSITIKP